MVTEFDHTLSKKEYESDVNKNKADSAEKELFRVRELLDTIKQYRKGDYIPRSKGMLRIQGWGENVQLHTYTLPARLSYCWCFCLCGSTHGEKGSDASCGFFVVGSNYYYSLTHKIFFPLP